MKCEFVNATLHSFKEILAALSPFEFKYIEIKEVFIREDKFTEKPLVIKVDFWGNINGSVLMSMELPTAIKLADYILTGGDYAKGFTELVQSALKEIVNMFTGGISNLLADGKINFDMSVPQLSFANRAEITTVQCPFPISLRIEIPAGEVELDIALAEDIKNHA